MTTVARHPSLRALLLGMALLAASCAGGDDTVSTETANPVGDATAESIPAAEGTADETGATDDTIAGADTDEPEAMTDDDSASVDSAEGEEPSAPAGGPPPSLPPEEARAAAEQNIPNLEASDDVRDIEVVSVYDGSITSLREVVTGDRPVLLWFWAPH